MCAKPQEYLTSYSMTIAMFFVILQPIRLKQPTLLHEKKNIVR